MAEFKGTKGKWNWSYPGGYELGILMSDTGVEVMNFGDTTTYYPTAGVEPNDYDSLLISKAPEMLDMLKMWCIDMEDRGRAYGDCYEMTKQLIKEATEL